MPCLNVLKTRLSLLVKGRCIITYIYCTPKAIILRGSCYELHRLIITDGKHEIISNWSWLRSIDRGRRLFSSYARLSKGVEVLRIIRADNMQCVRRIDLSKELSVCDPGNQEMYLFGVAAPEVVLTYLYNVVVPTKNNIVGVKKILSIIGQDSNKTICCLNGSSLATEIEITNECESNSVEFWRFDYNFNYSRLINDGVSKATYDFVILLNDDIEIVSISQLRELVGIVSVTSVGIVAPKLVYPDGSIQSCGIAVTEVQPLYSWKHYPDDPDNPWLTETHEVSAVTGACMVMRREVFEEVGGWDENLPVTLNDVDFCLKVREAGYKVIVHPKVKMIHHESVTRGKNDAAQNFERTKRERAYFKKKWKAWLKKGDPYYSKKLSRKYPDFRLRKYDQP
ncbi:MAG: glycosyltransferase family 2 protein [Bacteroidota bacterium]